jgi:tRNA(Ile)-lysidine synthetase-like protein
MNIRRTAIVGAGGWGTALAVLWSKQGNEITLWGHDPERTEKVRTTRENPDYLPGVKLPESISVTSDITDCADADLIVFVTPSIALRAVANQLCASLSDSKVVLLSGTKGIEHGTGMRMSQILEEIFPRNTVAVISGPNLAVEVSRDLPTATVLGCPVAECAEELQRHLPEGPSQVRYLSLHRKALLQLPLALRRRLVRAATPPGLQLEFRQVEEILAVAQGGNLGSNDAPATCNLADGWTFQRRGDEVGFVPPPPAERGLEKGAKKGVKKNDGSDFGGLRLPVPGQTAVPGSSRAFEAVRILLASPPAGYNPEHLYAPHALPSELVVRTWRFGDRFWPAHTKAPKKLKELFQVKKVPAELRASWPVMVTERDGREEVVWVQGFAAPAHLRPSPGDREAILLREHPLREHLLR